MMTFSARDENDIGALYLVARYFCAALSITGNVLYSVMMKKK